MSDVKWKIGAIVCLKSHYLQEDLNPNHVVLSGEPNLLPPLMVIIETLKEKTSYDEKSGMQLSDKSNYNCKCVWFSSKTFQFEDAWISSRLLYFLEDTSTSVTDFQIKTFGTKVELKTARYELGKKKSSIKQQFNKSSAVLTSHLEYVSPVLHVIGTAKYEMKESLYNSKTLEQIRHVPETLLKCKYYNYRSDKYSEVLLPVQCLNVIKEVNSLHLKLISEAIEKKSHLGVVSLIRKNNELQKAGEMLLTPTRINFRNGRYFLDGFDIIMQREVEMEIEETLHFHSLNNYFSTELPSFSEMKGSVSITQIDPTSLADLIKAIGKYKLVLIRYKDRFDNVTNRTIKDYSLTESAPEAGKPKMTYLKGHCLLRNAERFFNIERIQSLRVLTDITFHVPKNETEDDGKKDKEQEG